jgi:hypothetical protein
MWINPIVVSGSRRRFSAHPNRHGQRVIANRVARRFPGLFR